MSLVGMMASGLPLNRKERFYTGTVFPAIVCADDGAHFSLFTDLIPGYEPQQIDWQPETANIQFFTEYSFVESVFGVARERFPAPPRAKNTPDVMILIRGERSVLIAVEAKMFDNPDAASLDAQLQAQQEILDYLTEQLQLERVHHIALLPKGLADAVGQLRQPTVTWEQILDAFAPVQGTRYFHALLAHALSAWGELVSRGAQFGQNSEGKLTGAEIVRRYDIGEEPSLMGRNRGLHGPEVTEDIQTGRWKDQTYEVRKTGAPPNRKWFEVSGFVAKIRAHDERAEPSSAPLATPIPQRIRREQTSSWGANNEMKMPGALIVSQWRTTRSPAVMGRSGGLDGDRIFEDIRSGRWKTQRYETRSKGNPPNDNWFYVSDFIRVLERNAQL